ncbi:MAG: PilW family protein [Trichlorobacter sp.]|jgi:hypothetical protein|nr:PilW family protein [Trichlorobacter sp.]
MKNKAGFTLIELLVSLGFFALLGAMMYGTFDLMSKQVTSTSTHTELTDKGQRVLAFMEEDLRMIGFLLGPDAKIPYCMANPPIDSNVIELDADKAEKAANTELEDGTGFDRLTFLTSHAIPLEESDNTCTANNGNYLALTDTAEENTTQLNLNVNKAACFKGLENVNGTANAKSLITFDTLRLAASGVVGSDQQLYYTVQNVGAPQLTLKDTEPLLQEVPAGSMIYTIRQYRYSAKKYKNEKNEDTYRLRRSSSNKACVFDSTADLVDNLDGMKFEFIIVDPLTDTTETVTELPDSFSDLVAINIWLLLRADSPDPKYKNNTEYTLGTSADSIKLGPFNDNYRRVLLQKTVKVKNLASQS